MGQQIGENLPKEEEEQDGEWPTEPDDDRDIPDEDYSCPECSGELALVTSGETAWGYVCPKCGYYYEGST